ncbi:hypothetical protein D6T65_11190 [Arthrobacter frigidicola]|nr:hypothetical protein D6T65_11190 [Arthrobacter frigidicola]
MEVPVDFPVAFPTDVAAGVAADAALDVAVDDAVDVPVDFSGDLPVDLPVDFPAAGFTTAVSAAEAPPLALAEERAVAASGCAPTPAVRFLESSVIIALPFVAARGRTEAPGAAPAAHVLPPQ